MALTATTGSFAAPRTTRPLIAALLSCLVMAALMAVGASSAKAGTAHRFLFAFNGAETKAREFTDIEGLAVDGSASVSAGDVYVADGEAHVVDKFNGAGGLLSEIKGPTPASPFAHPRSMAVDPKSGEVYVVNAAAMNGEPDVVDRFTPAGGFVETIAVAGALTGLAVDATTGDVYIATVAHVEGKELGTVQRFNPTTKVLGTFATGTLGGPFGSLPGIAVDNSGGASAGDVYVAEGTNHESGSPGVIYKFNSAGEQQLETPAGPFSAVGGVAVDPATGDVYVTDALSAVEGVVDQFTSGGVFVSRVTGAQTRSGSLDPSQAGVAFSAAGDVLVADHRNRLVDVFGPGVVVPDVTTLAATEVAATSATLNGKVKPDELALTGCEFQLVPQEQFGGSELVEGSEFNHVTASEKVPCVPAAASIPADNEEHAVSAHVTNLTPGVTYHYRLVAANANGEGEPGAGEEVSTLPPPAIVGATVANLVSGSADLVVTIDPNGSPTYYHVEYGETTAYGSSVPVPDKNIGEGTANVIEAQHITKLEAPHVYHWRVLATNANGTTVGGDHVFVYPRTGLALADGRAYEMVTPVHKNGAIIGDVATGGNPDIAANGTRVIAESIQCFAGAESCNGQNADSVGSPYAFTRSDVAGQCAPAAPPCWRTTALAPPSGELSHTTFWGASAQAGTALFSSPTEPFGEDDFYGATLQEGAPMLTHIGPVTPPEGGAQGVAGGGTPGAPEESAEAVSEDLSHVVWVTESGYWPSLAAAEPGQHALYEYAGDGSSHPLVVAVTGGQESSALIATCGAYLAGNFGERLGKMSADGRTIFFEAAGKPGCTGTGVNQGVEAPVKELFARVDGEGAGARTVAISEPQAPEAGLTPGPREECKEASCVADTSYANRGADWRNSYFMGASADGGRVFFESEQRLTDGASEGTGGGAECHLGVTDCNLYLSECFAECEGEHEQRRLLDVSAGDTSGAGPRVQGVLAVSEDGSHVYFVAKGVLSGGERPGCMAEWQAAGRTSEADCRPQTGAENLYVYERDAAYPAGRVAFIGDLPRSDFREWQEARPANVTPEGRYLVFVSGSDVTADDTSSSGARQVFRYDAQTGGLTRVSIGESGFNDNGNLPGGDATIPFANFLGLGSGRRDPTMSDDGSRVFFQSPHTLTNKALAGAQNVYEWEREGAGSCPPAQSAGCVFLISDGQDASHSVGPQQCAGLSVCLLGSDATGTNIFFTTADGLVPKDTDGELDIYDARTCTPASPCIQEPPAAPAACDEEACHGTPPAVPPPPATPSSTFNGHGNVYAAPSVQSAPLTRAQKLTKALSSCRRRYKHSRKRRRACEKQAHSAYGASARRATNNGRAK